jgi:large subunit ribosomal protein L17
MRHRKRGRHLGRTSAHREAMRRNLVSNLFLVERIRTTPAKAKEVRGMAEKLITLARKGGLAEFRRALAMLDDKFIVRKLFREIGPRYTERQGGYTRILHLSRSQNRLGDNAPQVILELVPEGQTEAGSASSEKSASSKA